MKTLVSVIILNWNGKNHLSKCLSSLHKITYKPVEIIVVDNNSSDGSQSMVRHTFPHVKLIANDANLGYSEGNNRGISQAKGDFILILNNDTEVTIGFLDPLVNQMHQDSTIGCVQPKLLYASDHRLINAVGSYLTNTGFLYHYGYRKKSDLIQYNKPLNIFSAKGAAMLLRRQALDSVGLFDEDFFIYFEETDLCHRLWLAGYSVVYQPSSVIYHHEAVDTKRQFNLYFPAYLSFRNRIYSFMKNLEFINLLWILFVLSIVYGGLFLFYTLQLQFSLARSIPDAIVWNMKNLKKILKKRRKIQMMRKKSDHELFSVIIHNPPLVYYYYLFTTLKDYRYEKPIDEAKYI